MELDGEGGFENQDYRALQYQCLGVDEGSRMMIFVSGWWDVIRSMKFWVTFGGLVFCCSCALGVVKERSDVYVGGLCKDP